MQNIKRINEKSVGWRRFEFVLLVVVLMAAVLRGTHMESLQSVPGYAPGVLDGPGWSIVTSAVLVFTTVLWWAISFSRRQMFYRFGGMEIGTLIFLAAAVWGIFDASNKRAAISETMTIAAVFVTAILLVQLMDSQKRIRLVLMVIVAAGALNTYQCAEQYFISNDILIQQYENNPEAQLAQIGIEPGSFEHSLYLHRLESKDVRGFFATGNSAAAFNVIALIAAAMLFMSEYRSQGGKTKIRNLFIYGAYTTCIAWGLSLTHSKGGIGGLVLAGILFGMCVLCMKCFKKYSRGLIISGIILAAAGLGAIIAYGVKHDGFGGGNSMLVRWQYWSSTAQMCRDNFWEGVGGGNFASWYTKYKIPAAIETVKDPHCFVLSVLSQYGIFGLIGFVGALAVPMLRAAFGEHSRKSETVLSCNETAGKWKHGAIAAVVLTVGVFFLRPFVMNDYLGQTPDELIFMILYQYVSAGVVFGVAMLFLWIAGKDRDESEMMFSASEITLGLCGLVGVLVHNLVDFAMFEPGVLTMLMVMVACVYAMNVKTKGEEIAPVKLNRVGRIGGVAVCLIVSVVVVKFALGPVVSAGKLRQKAISAHEHIPQLLDAAAGHDNLNPEYWNMSGKMYLQMFMNDPEKSPESLANSAQRFYYATMTDPADFKNYEKAAQVFKLWAEVVGRDAQAAKEKRQAAYEQLLKAVELYPGSDRINYKLGEICELLKNDQASKYYAKAVEIEEAYRIMFMKMYPGRGLTSRLGEDKYQRAKQKLDVRD